jgi:hypothetical protein
MAKNEKYIFSKFKILNGGFEYSELSIHAIPKISSTEKFVRDYASNFYDDGEMYDGNRDKYEFNGGEVIVEVKDFKEISKEDYDVLVKYL